MLNCPGSISISVLEIIVRLMSSSDSSIEMVNDCNEFPVLLASRAMDEFPFTGMTATA